MSDTSGDDWSSWASRLKVGDGVWYQRCEGTEVEARVVEICATSSTCWVQYHVKPPKGGRQNRRALVKVEELMRVQQDHERSPSSSLAASARASEEPDSAFEASWASEGYTPTVAETMPAQRLLRSRGLSMVLNDEDIPVPSGRRRLLRACSMVTCEEESFRRARATSMIDSDDVESVVSSTNQSGILPRRTTAASMIFSESSGNSFHEPRKALSMLSNMPEHWLDRDGQVSKPSQRPPRGALSMLSEMPEHWLAMDEQVSEPSQEPPRGALSMLSEMPEQWFARDGQEWVPSQEPQGSEFDFDLPPEPSEKGDPDGSQGGSFSTSMSRQELPEEPVSESEKTETSISCSAHHGVKGHLSQHLASILPCFSACSLPYTLVSAADLTAEQWTTRHLAECIVPLDSAAFFAPIAAVQPIEVLQRSCLAICAVDNARTGSTALRVWQVRKRDHWRDQRPQPFLVLVRLQMIEAPQGKRFTPVTSSLRWQSLKRLACGCQGDYISAASDSSSLRLQQAKVKDVDPLEVMQVGRHVLYYNPKARRFESRVVKIDEQLSFLFVLQEGTLKEPFAARLYEVDEVVTSTRAMQICEELDLSDEYLMESTAVVVTHTRSSKDRENLLNHDKVMVFVAPPAMKLVDHIAACVELSKLKFSAGADDEEGVRLKDTGRYLDAARIGNCAAIFFHYSTGVELEFTLRPADSVEERQDYESKMPITHMISFPIEYGSVKMEINKLLDRLGILPALDLTRLSLVMYEMVIHRHWIHPHMKLFPGGMYEFMHDRNGLQAHFNVSAEVQSQILEVPQPPRRQMDVHYYSSRALQATTLALKHLLSLETVFQAADKRKVSESPEDVTQGVQIFCRSSRRPDDEELSHIDEELYSDEEPSETWKEPGRRSSGGVVLDVSTEPPEFEDVSDVEDFAFAVGLEPDHVDVFCQSALERCGTCPTSVKAYTTHKVERELSELCRLLEHKAASLASTTCDPDQDDTSSSKHTTSEDGDWERDPADFLAPVQAEASAESDTTISGSAVVATRAEREREADPDASRLKKPGFMDRMLRTFCPSLVKSRSDKGERGDEVANLPRFAGAESSSAPEPLRPDTSPGSPSSLGAGVGDIE
ncbi:unnamed protein product [Symbiodinium sp. CCMP2592]|nr:unnamed protein product [Symbiodinium sp. CCMP2592]